MKDTVLYDRIFGCIAGSRIGSAMGAATEGMTRDQIRETFGRVETLLPYEKHENDVRWHNSTQVFHYKAHKRPAGTTEDGIERQKLICNAIAEKNGRVNAEDVARIWVRDMKVENFGYLIEPCDNLPYYLARAGLYPRAIGQYNEWPGIISIARSIHPIGLVNACNPESAAEDAREIASLYQPHQGVGIPYTRAYAAAIAEAVKPNATFDDALRAMFEYGGSAVREDVEKALEVAARRNDFEEAIDEINASFTSDGIYMSYSEELIPRACAIVYICKADPRECCIAGTNAGRDTDCVTALAAGLAGALAGKSTIPDEWVETVDRATVLVPWSVCKKSLEEVSTDLYRAVQHEAGQTRRRLALLDELTHAQPRS